MANRATPKTEVERKEIAAALRVWRLVQREKGLCNSCHFEVVPGRRTCRYHQLYYREAQRKARAHQ